MPGRKKYTPLWNFSAKCRANGYFRYRYFIFGPGQNSDLRTCSSMATIVPKMSPLSFFILVKPLVWVKQPAGLYCAVLEVILSLPFLLNLKRHLWLNFFFAKYVEMSQNHEGERSFFLNFLKSTKPLFSTDWNFPLLLHSEYRYASIVRARFLNVLTRCLALGTSRGFSLFLKNFLSHSYLTQLFSNKIDLIFNLTVWSQVSLLLYLKNFGM